jgi:hypothetical protein
VTVLDLLTGALAELNVADATTVLGSDDSAFALRIFNDYLDGLAVEQLSIYSVTRVTWTLTPSVATYTIGVGATINVARPVSPQAIAQIGYQIANVSPVNEFALPLLTEPAYAAWSLKGMTSAYPTAFYYNPTFGTTGYGTISPLPIPTAAGLQGVIYVNAPVTEFAAPGDTVSLPPGYRRFLRLNLALELASAYQVAIPPGLEARAHDARADVKRANSRLDDMDTGSVGRYDIFSDGYR